MYTLHLRHIRQFKGEICYVERSCFRIVCFFLAGGEDRVCNSEIKPLIEGIVPVSYLLLASSTVSLKLVLPFIIVNSIWCLSLLRIVSNSTELIVEDSPSPVWYYKWSYLSSIRHTETCDLVLALSRKTEWVIGYRLGAKPVRECVRTCTRACLFVCVCACVCITLCEIFYSILS